MTRVATNLPQLGDDMDDEETTPLSILRPCAQCGNELAPINQHCANCQYENLCALKSRIFLGRKTDWPPFGNSGGLFHDDAMKQSYTLVEQARTVGAHFPYSVQIAMILSRAMQAHPEHWGATFGQGDIPL